MSECAGTEHNNCIVKAPRQCGKTLISIIHILWKMMYSSDKRAVLFSSSAAQSESLLALLKQIYLDLPEHLKPAIKHRDGGWTKNSVWFENNCNIWARHAPNAVKGASTDYVFVDEFAHLRNQTEFMMCVFPSQCARRSAQMILASTPKGTNEAFYEIWQKAKNKQTSFVPISVEWNEIPGRNLAWKKKMLLQHGAIFVKQEYECKFVEI